MNRRDLLRRLAALPALALVPLLPTLPATPKTDEGGPYTYTDDVVLIVDKGDPLDGWWARVYVDDVELARGPLAEIVGRGGVDVALEARFPDVPVGAWHHVRLVVEAPTKT